jgi:hypothetical protein
MFLAAVGAWYFIYVQDVVLDYFAPHPRTGVWLPSDSTLWHASIVTTAFGVLLAALFVIGASLIVIATNGSRLQQTFKRAAGCLG